jgi:bacillolysin
MSSNAQTHIPKFAQLDNKSIKELTVNVENNGWLFFRSNAKVKANELFLKYRDAMGLQENDKMVLKKTWHDELGYLHNRYQQYYKGVEVMHGVFAEHFARNDDNMYLANGKIVEGIDIDVNPSVKEQNALENAIKQLGAVEYAWQNPRIESELKQELDSNATYFPKGKLVFSPSKEEDYTKSSYKLTWQFEIHASQPASLHCVFVDAHSGEVLRVIKMGHGNGPAELRYYGIREIDTQWQGGWHQDFRLYANDGDRDIVTKIGGDQLTGFDNSSNIRDVTINAATAHWAATKTWDFYQHTFNRCGTNGCCEFLRVWSDFQGPTNSWVTNGDWRLGISLNPNGNTEATLDIVGHEFTHGVLFHEEGPGFPHGPKRENGALAESLGDIMGFMVERTTLGEDNLKNVTHGEACGQIFRNFRNPSSISSIINGVSVQHPNVFQGTQWHNPTDETFDDGGVHHNCSVMNHWFYLLGNGQSGTGSSGTNSITVNGIGYDKAAQIVYRSMTTGKLSNTSKFPDARTAMIQSAKELYGNCSNEMIQTAQAWAKVGVGNPLVCTDPVYVYGSSSYGSIICVNSLEYPYAFFAYDKPGTTFTWNYPTHWTAQINGSQLTVSDFGSVYDGQGAVITATSSTGQIGAMELLFSDCTNNPMLKGKVVPSKLLLNVFPNPTSELLVLKTNRKKSGKVQIFDSIGRLIFTKNLGFDEDFIDVSTLKNGLYSLKLTVEDESSNASFFKN